MVEPVFGGKRVQSVTFLGRAANSVIAAHARIQFGMRRAPLKDWIPALAGMTKARTVDAGSTIFVVGARKLQGF